MHPEQLAAWRLWLGTQLSPCPVLPGSSPSAPTPTHTHTPTHTVNAPQGIAFFVRALPAARAEAVRGAVEAAAAPLDPAPGDSGWETYHLFLECIEKRAAKVGWAAPPPVCVV